MGHWAAITVLGHDRPGIVAGITGVLFEHGCNLEDSSATRLRDSFAMILIASLPDPPGFEALTERLAAVAEALGVAVDVRDLGQAPPEPAPTGDRYLLSVYGADQPGIVYRVSRELARSGCNVENVATRVAGSSERPIYVMTMELCAPESLSLEALSEQLARLRTEVEVDITLRRLEEETL